MMDCEINFVRNSTCRSTAYLFTLFINQNFIPSEWTTVIMNPLYKGKGENHDVTCFRSVSLTCAICRRFESYL